MRCVIFWMLFPVLVVVSTVSSTIQVIAGVMIALAELFDHAINRYEWTARGVIRDVYVNDPRDRSYREVWVRSLNRY